MADATSTPRVLRFEASAARELELILARFPRRQAALLPVLRLAEREFGRLDPPALRVVADALDLAPAHVWGVFSFYTHFRTEAHGRYVIDLCSTLPCALRGARDLVRHLEDRLGIRTGGTTSDGLFTLRKVECLGRCDRAPLAQVNFRDDHYKLTPERLDELLDQLRAEAKDAPAMD